MLDARLQSSGMTERCLSFYHACHSYRPPLSFPPVFSGNPSSREFRGSGNDKAYRMTEKRKDAGCPITTVGHDRERGGPVLPVVSPLSFPQVFSGNPSSRESRRSGHNKASRMTEKRKDAGCPITTVGHDSERRPPHLSFPSGSSHLSFLQSPICPSRRFLAGIQGTGMTGRPG